MALALCPHCDRLVRIEAHGHRVDRDGMTVRQRAWIVQPHTAVDDDSGGRQCAGTGRTV
jgi:hypothetical protein